MIVEDLKKSIYQFAFSGKLTFRSSDDSSVKKNLENIKIINDKYINIGEKKKDSKILPIKESEYPFCIPEEWEWTKIYNIIDVRDGTHDSPHFLNKGVPLVTSKNLKSDGELDMKNVKFISEYDAENINKRSNVDINDILFAMIGSIGNPVIVKTQCNFCIKNVSLFKNIINDYLKTEYLYYYLDFMQDNMKRESTGGVQKFVSLNYLRNFYIPLPSIEEQKRIVDKIDELFAKLDEIKPIEEELTSIKNKFPYEMKKSILASAFEGKLTMRMKSDSSIDCLIEQIRQIRNKKIKNKEAKADKYSDVVKYNLYFDIPDEWKWLKAGEIGNWGSGSTPERGNAIYYENGTVCWLKTGELTDGYVGDSEEKITELALSKCSLKINNPGDILIAMYGATIGKLAIATTKTTTNQACCGCSLYGDMNNKYLFYYLLSIRHKLISLGEGSGQPNISREKIINLPIPIPSIEEQDRIVKKIEQLLPLCNDIDNLVNN